jgi:thiamine-phosphate pyrophosphorylase
MAIGPVFATASKVSASEPVVGIEGVRRAAARAARRGIPVVAIGGVTLERAPEVLAAGAASVAVIADLLVGEPETRIRQYARNLSNLTL